MKEANLILGCMVLTFVMVVGVGMGLNASLYRSLGWGLALASAMCFVAAFIADVHKDNDTPYGI